MKANNKEVFTYLHHAFKREVDTMLHLLQKAIDYSREKGVDEKDVLDARLAPDMFPFVKQVQVFTDNVAGAIARLSGNAKPSLPDTETSFAELVARTEKVKEFINSVDPEKVEGLNELKIKLPWMPGNTYFEGGTYLQNYTMQNATFHLVIAYGILRHIGVHIGKTDYMGNIEMKSE